MAIPAARKERLYLIDAMALAYRAYFAFIRQPLMNSKGENTSAVYGFVTFLNRILSQEFPDHIAVVFDTAKPTFRHNAYKEYKATRQKMPDDMITQIPIIKEIVRAYNIPVIEMDGYEADDIIGTLAKQAEREGVLTFLVTPDKDFMQLVSDSTKIFKPGKLGTDIEIVDQEGVKQKFGVSPDKVIEVMGLIGDASDNVPGVRGIGEKTAIPLIQKYGSIEDLYKHLDEIPQKGVRSKLEANRELAFLSRQLVTIDIQVPLPINFHSLKAEKRNRAKLLELFGALEFRSLLSKLQSELPDVPEPGDTDIEFTAPAPLSDITTDQHRYTLITSEQEFSALCSTLKSAKEFVFDTETTSTDSLNAELVGISFALKPHEAFYVAVTGKAQPEDGSLFGNNDRQTNTGEGLPPELVCRQLKPIFENPRIKKIGYNIKYDMLVLSQYDITVRGALFDPMIASYIVRADGQHNMDDIALEYLSYKTVSYSDLTGTGKEQKNIREVSLALLSDYSCEDSDMTYRLYEYFQKRLVDLGMIKLCEEMEFPLIAVLTRMERSGVAIDVGLLSTMSKELELQLDTLTREIHKAAGIAFNINSTQQLSEILFNRLHLNPVRKTKSGFSTDVAVLEALKGEHPIIDMLLDFRQSTKLKSTYIDTLPKLMNARTGRVHTSFNQTVATTGRLSSSDPNIQNIPIRTEIGRAIRKAFIAGDADSLLLSADYSQIELRVMAHISGDESMMEAFRNHEDIHTTTAAKVFGVTGDEITREMRRKAKEVNFGIMYGIGAYGLANRLEISQSEAKDIITRYFARFPKVQQYIGDTIEGARTNGYVSTLLGRRRYIADIRSNNKNIRQNAERQSINMPIQGTAADMIKLAMVHIDAEMIKQNLRSSMLLQVHDELVFEVRMNEEALLKKLVEREMTQALPLSVPVEVDLGIGKNWLEAH
ncbi:MAG: DNA polymerase I [Ignavibacteriae bacterium]|nr:MAG: DNA polymerase I [Ignavibacteriota bacterium]